MTNRFSDSMAEALEAQLNINRASAAERRANPEPDDYVSDPRGLAAEHGPRRRKVSQ